MRKKDIFEENKELRAIDNGRMARYIEEYVSEAISSIVSDFHNGIDVIAIKN